MIPCRILHAAEHFEDHFLCNPNCDLNYEAAKIHLGATVSGAGSQAAQDSKQTASALPHHTMPPPAPAWAVSPLPALGPSAVPRLSRARPLSARRRPRAPAAARMALDAGDLADVPTARAEEPKRPLDELVDFPTVFTFKVVGLNAGDFVGDITAAAAAALGTEERHLKTTFRDRGKYRSITLRAPVSCSNEIYSVYAAVGKVRRLAAPFAFAFVAAACLRCSDVADLPHPRLLSFRTFLPTGRTRKVQVLNPACNPRFFARFPKPPHLQELICAARAYCGASRLFQVRN